MQDRTHIRDMDAHMACKANWGVHDVLKNLLRGVSMEGRPATEQDVQDHSTAPDVCLFAVLSPEDLRGCKTQVRARATTMVRRNQLTF